MARRRASLLNRSYSALVAAASVPASSVAAVSAAGVSNATPSTALNRAMAAFTCSRSPVKSETTFNAIGEFVLSTDEPFAVFDADVGSWSELFRVALDGGPEVSLSGDLVAGGGFEDFQLAPGSGRVVYVADQLVNERFELFSVASDGSAAPVRLNGTLPANADVDQEFVIHPDGSTVVALGELLANDVRELFRIPVDGSAVPARISAPRRGSVATTPGSACR